MPKLLTKRKQKWAGQFKPEYLRGSALNPNIAIAHRYQQKLDKYIDEMTSGFEKQILKLFKKEPAQEYFAQDDTISSQARILTNALMRKFNKMFEDISKPLAEKLASDSEKASSASLHMSLKELSGGLSLNTRGITTQQTEILNATVTENVGLIKSISSKYLTEVQGAVMRSITTGDGLKDLIPALQKSKEITYRRARMIALDQTRKAFNNINVAKMDDLGIKQFEWLHSGGSNEPRRLHIALSGRIFSLDNPPIIDNNTGERGLPGKLINCRCRMLPVIKFNE